MKKILKLLAPLPLLFLTPLLAFAQETSCTGKGLGGALCRIEDILSAALPLLISLAVIYIVWGIVRYMIGDGEEAKTKGRDTIIYGIIGLAIIISLWGIVYLVADTLGV